MALNIKPVNVTQEYKAIEYNISTSPLQNKTQHNITHTICKLDCLAIVSYQMYKTLIIRYGELISGHDNTHTYINQ
jgi:hypothetical protein